MLHRTTSAPVWSPVRWVTGRLGALTGPSSGLLRYVLIAAVLAAMGCVYLWQVNDLSDPCTSRPGNCKGRRAALEQDNVLLAEQLAQVELARLRG